MRSAVVLGNSRTALSSQRSDAMRINYLYYFPTLPEKQLYGVIRLEPASGIPSAVECARALIRTFISAEEVIDIMVARFTGGVASQFEERIAFLLHDEVESVEDLLREEYPGLFLEMVIEPYLWSELDRVWFAAYARGLLELDLVSSDFRHAIAYLVEAFGSPATLEHLVYYSSNQNEQEILDQVRRMSTGAL